MTGSPLKLTPELFKHINLTFVEQGNDWNTAPGSNTATETIYSTRLCTFEDFVGKSNRNAT